MISRGGFALKASRKRSTNTGLDRGHVMPDLVIAPARGLRRRMFRPVERALASQRRGRGVIRLEPAQQGPEHGVMPQVVVVDQVLVAKRQAEDALPHQAPHPMGDEGWMTTIAKHEANRSTSRIA